MPEDFLLPAPGPGSDAAIAGDCSLYVAENELVELGVRSPRVLSAGSKVLPKNILHAKSNVSAK